MAFFKVFFEVIRGWALFNGISCYETIVGME